MSQYEEDGILSAWVRLGCPGIRYIEFEPYIMRQIICAAPIAGAWSAHIVTINLYGEQYEYSVCGGAWIYERRGQ